MQKWRNILLCAAVSFMFLFMAVGYAQLTDNLTVSGSADLKEIKTIYIKSISISTSNSTGTASVTQNGLLSFEHSSYSLNKQKTDKKGNITPGGSVTISVTVKNNSGIDQYFGYHSSMNQDALKKLQENCVITYNQSGQERLIADKATKTFTFTIQNVNQNNSFSFYDFESLLVFSPNLTQDDTQNATDALAKIFANVLAGKGPKGDGSGIVYQGQNIAAADIMTQITNKMTDVETGGYTGNVGNATQAEKDLMSAIFGDNIIFQIGDNYYSVYILIKNQQIDGKGDKDMVIYITADQLNMGSGGWVSTGSQTTDGYYGNLNDVPVYALVYIKGNNGYTYCDHLFQGKAPVCDFGGAFGDGKVGNFNTNLWVSTEYSVKDDDGQVNSEWISADGQLDEAYGKFTGKN